MSTQQEFDLVIRAGAPISQYWRDVWGFRELFYFLAWRDLAVRYKQTVIGVAWSLLRPLLTMLIFSLVFGKLAGMPSGGAPYPVMVFAALLPWQFFSNALSESSASLISNSNLLSKVYFPRIIVPVSATIVSLVDFLISLVLLFILMGGYHVPLSWRLLTIPLFLLFAILVALGAGFWLAALNVKYRDFRYVVPFLLQLGLYVSPVGFRSEIVPDAWRFWYSLNPMVGVIDGFRWAIIGQGGAFYWPGIIASVGLSLVLFSSGIWYFRRMERVFADVV